MTLKLEKIRGKTGVGSHLSLLLAAAVGAKPYVAAQIAMPLWHKSLCRLHRVLSKVRKSLFQSIGMQRVEAYGGEGSSVPFAAFWSMPPGRQLSWVHLPGSIAV